MLVRILIWSSVFLSSINLLFSQCTGFAPSFTNTANKTCGLPRIYNFTNTSTGTKNNVARYIWYVNYRFVRLDTGLKALQRTFTQPGTYRVTLIARDTGVAPCVDSSFTSITIAASSPQIEGSNSVFSYNPQWVNCILSPGAKDTFGVTVRANDTLHNYRIEWGDSVTSVTSGVQLLTSQSVYHRYNTLGVFRVRIISGKGTCLDTIIGQVINERNPVASILGPPSGLNYGCTPFTTRFINTSPYASPGTTFTWDFGDFITTILPASTFKDTIFHTYRRFTCNGTVQMIATNACGSSTATWSPIQMGDKDTAIIQPTNPTNCNLLIPFTFNNNSQTRYCLTPNPRRFRWLWGDGTSTAWSTSNAPQSKLFTSRGSFNVKLIDSNSCGKDTADFILRIDSLPVSLAFANPVEGCAPLLVNFNAQSQNRVTARLWNFGHPASGAGNTSTDSLTTHTYPTGNYNAILSLTNGCGTLRDTFPIRATGKVDARFDNITGGCFPYVVNFNNTSIEYFTTSTQYSWLLPDGTTSNLKNPPAITLNLPNTYTTRLIATDSCGSDTLVRTFDVYGKPPLTVSLLSTSPCQSQQLLLSYTTNNAGNQITWYHDDYKTNLIFSGSTTINHNYTFDSLRTYNNRIIIRDVNNCRDTVFLALNVNPVPNAIFTITDSVNCTPLIFSSTNSSIHNGAGTFAQLSHRWQVNGITVDTNAVLNNTVFSGSKTKDSLPILSLIVINSFKCSAIASKPLLIYPKPRASFTENKDSICGPASVLFTNTSTPFDTGSIAIMSFNWQFGNGVTTTNVNPSILFQPGVMFDSVYLHGLIAISEHGCRDTSYGSTYIYPIPIVNFSLSSLAGCRPFTPTFTNLSNPKNGGAISIMNFNWTFGDGTKSNSRTPSQIYNVKRDTNLRYTIKLIGTSEHGCKDSTTNQITVYPSPVGSYGPLDTAVCQNIPVTLRNKTTNRFSDFWFVNNVLVSNNANLTYSFKGLYFRDTVYNIKLTSTSSNGCPGDTAKGVVRIKFRPLSLFSPANDTICFNTTTQFFNESLGAVNYNWNFGNGSTSSRVNPDINFIRSYNPAKDTTYNVRLIASAFNGCRDTFIAFKNVLPYPIARFRVDTNIICAPNNIQFYNQSANAVTYFWDFGNGQTSTLANPNIRFDNRGFSDTQYKVILYAFTLKCTDTFSRIIKLRPKPIAFYNADKANPCSNTYNFFNNSVRANTYLYSFGDGQTATIPNPSHAFIPSSYRDTSYNSKLVVTSIYGCKDSITRIINLSQRLLVGFKDTTINTCPPYLVKFTSRTIGAIVHIWDFGDNTGSSDKNPTHIYTKPGVYKFKLKVFDPIGCIDSAASAGTITIRERPTALFDFNPKDLRINQTTLVNFTNLSLSTVPLTSFWNFNDPNSNGIIDKTQIQNPNYNYTDSGNYTTQLIVYNGGCYDTFSLPLRVKPPFPIPSFKPDFLNECAPLLVNFINSTQYAATYLWQFGDGDTSTAVNPSHIYRYPGQYDVSLIAYGSGGEIKITKFASVIIKEKPFAYFDIGPGLVYLTNPNIYTENGSSRANRYQWLVISPKGNVEYTDTVFQLKYSLKDTGNYTFILIAFNQYGCPDTMIRVNAVKVNPASKYTIPNAFSPDANNLNDGFKPILVNEVKNGEYSFKIFNRWGQKVFQTNDPNQAWFGNYLDKPCQTEVYIYLIEVDFVTGEKVRDKGVVHLIR